MKRLQQLVARRLRKAGWQVALSARGLWHVTAVRADQPVRLIRILSEARWDAKTERLGALARSHRVPIDYELWVFTGTKPVIWAPTPDGWEIQPER